MLAWLKSRIHKMAYRIVKGDLVGSSLLFQNTFGNLTKDIDKWKPSDFFDADPWLASVLTVVAETVAETTMGCYVLDNNKKVYIENEATQFLLDSPNESEDWFDFNFLSVIYLELEGNVYWEMSGDSEGNPQLKILPPSCVTPGINRITGEVQYQYRAKDPINGVTKTVYYEKDQIIHLRYPNHRNDFLGRSRLESCKRDMIISYEARVFNQSWLENGCTPDGYTKVKQEPESIGWRRMRARRALESAGYKNAGKREYLVEGEEFVPTTAAPKDMQYVELLKQSRESVLAAMRVPPAIMGIFEYANYANSQVQKLLFQEGSILPRLNRLSRKLTVWARKATGNQKLIMGFRTEDIPALQPDKEVTARVATTIAGGAIADIDEARALLNLEPLKQGQKVLVSGGLISHDVATAELPDLGGDISIEDNADPQLDTEALARELNALSLAQQRLASGSQATQPDLELLQQLRARISMLLSGRKPKTKPQLKIYNPPQEDDLRLIAQQEQRVIHQKRRVIG